MGDGSSLCDEGRGGCVMFRVVDCPFNRAWCAELIGAVMAVPPSYAVVVEDKEGQGNDGR